MTFKTAAELVVFSTGTFYDNTTGKINPLNFRNMNQHITDSMIPYDASGVAGIKVIGTGNVPTPTPTGFLVYDGGVQVFNGTAWSGIGGGGGGGGTTYTAGTGLQLVGTVFNALTASTSVTGVTVLTNTIDSSQSKALTPKAVNDANYLASGDNISVLVNDSGYLNAHPTISNAASNSDNAGRVYIQDLLFDGNGHVTGVTTATETGIDTTYTAGTGLALNGAEFYTSGDADFNSVTVATGVILTSATPAVTTNKLYNIGGTLYFNGSVVDSAGGGGGGANWTVADGLGNSEVIASGDTVYVSGVGSVTSTYATATNIISVSGTDTTYTAGSGIELSGTTFNSLTASTSVTGITILTDTIDSTQTKALTPKAVYDAGYLTTHPSISAASDSNNSGRTYIQDILLDSNGHVTGVATVAETGIESYTAGTGLQLNSTTFDLNVASAVQTTAANSITTTASKTYSVQVDSSDNLVVNVPWASGSGGDITSVVAGSGLSGGGTTGDVTLNVSGVNTSLLQGTVANNQLANSSVTITAGTGLSNGGSVYLGGTITLDVETLNQDTTGSAGTLSPGRTINGVAFDGSANITVTASGSTLSDTVPVSKGGTNTTSFPDKSVLITQDTGTDTVSGVAIDANGELLIGGTSGPAVATLTQGSNVTITNADGGITIAAADTTYTAGSGIELSGTTFNAKTASTSASGITTLTNTIGTSETKALTPKAVNDANYLSGTLNQDTTGSAATLTTARAIAVTGDVTGTVNFDGSTNVSITTSLSAGAVDLAHMSDDSVGITELSATGTASSSTFLRGDNFWTTPTASVDIDALSAGVGLDQTTDHFIFSNAGTEKKITFSNLQDAVFADVSGDGAIAAGGALTIADDKIGSGELVDACSAVTSFTAPLIEGSTSIQTPLIEYTNGDDAITINSGGSITLAKAVKGAIATATEDATVVIDLRDSNYFEITLGANVTNIDFTNGSVGQRFIIRFEQPSGANYSIVYSAVTHDLDGGGSPATVTVSWPGGTAPTMTATNDKADTYGFIVRAEGHFDGYIIGQNIAETTNT
jgi:hypothetical protein